MASPELSLLRLEDRLWNLNFPMQPGNTTISQIRIAPKDIENPNIAYKAALVAANVISKAKDISTLNLKSTIIDVRNNGTLNGKWKLELSECENKSWYHAIKQKIPFFRKIDESSSLRAEISKTDLKITGIWNRLFVKPKQEIEVTEKINLPTLCKQFKPNASFYERIAAPPFSDPFTTLAAEALQTIETNFVYGLEVKGNLRFILDDNGKLEIRGNSPEDNIEGENSKTAKAYYTFIKEEYGEDIIATVEHAFGFKLQKLIDEDLPLHPDHIFKINIGVNNLRMDNLETLYEKLQQLMHRLSNKSAEINSTDILSYREIRSLFAQINTLTQSKSPPPNHIVLQFLDQLGIHDEDQQISDLYPDQLNMLIDILKVPDAYRDDIFTGRKITHLAICGYPTMGDSSKADPSRSLHELLQIFPDLENNENWDTYFELLAHVVAKKEPVTKCPPKPGESEDEWKVGTLIPAPVDRFGKNRWYQVKTVMDDGDGNFNYFLEPVTMRYRDDNGRALPAIKLYRSTASSGNAINSEDSVRADANPVAAPGPLDPTALLVYENPTFDQRTIPVWVGYLLLAKNYAEKPNPDPMMIETTLLAALEIKSIGDNDIRTLAENLKIHDEISNAKIILNEKNSPEMLLAFLSEWIDKLLLKAKELNEHPSQKTPQDIIFVGHSLGGALAQGGLFLQSANRKRIPCPGYTFKCYAADTPAIDKDSDISFMSFGREHRALISNLNGRWSINYQFEYGDIVPEAGVSLLGTTKREESVDSQWLEVTARVCEPLPSAKAQEIVTMPTHGRRFGNAKVGVDFKATVLTPAQLANFHSWYLSSDLRQIFGYRFLNSPKITELVRRTLGLVSFPIMQIKNVIQDKYIRRPEGKRDERGIWALSQQPKIKKPEAIAV